MTMPDPLAVVIDRTPPEELWPNKGKHKRTKEPHVAVMKAAGASAAINALAGRDWSWNGPIRLVLEIYWHSGQRRLDFDNAISACKSAIDGVFTKLNADDRQVRWIELTQDHDRVGDGYCVILVEPVETNR